MIKTKRLIGLMALLPAITVQADDSLKGASDVYLLGTMKWNHGVHNFMAYTMGNVPVGA